jgi:hypothetical protein
MDTKDLTLVQSKIANGLAQTLTNTSIASENVGLNIVVKVVELTYATIMEK